jgi:carboxymethylenebutenolidase
MRTVEVPTPDGRMKLYEVRPDAPRGAVLVIQEAFGVNDHIEDVTRRFADAGYHAVAPHLFHRTGDAVIPYDDFSKIPEHFMALDDEKLLADVDAALDHLRGAGWRDRQIGIVGFCFGGRVTFLASLRRPIGAGVGIYGGGITAQRAPQFAVLVDEAESLQAPWLGFFGDLDKGIPVEDVERLRAALARAPLANEVVRYAEAEHGFFCDRRASYGAQAAADAWPRTLAWFERHLEKGSP